MALDTGKVLHCRSVVVTPATNLVIKAVENMTRRQGFTQLKFTNRDGFFFPNAHWIAGVDYEENFENQIEERDTAIEEDDGEEEVQDPEEVQDKFIPDPYENDTNPIVPNNNLNSNNENNVQNDAANEEHKEENEDEIDANVQYQDDLAELDNFEIQDLDVNDDDDNLNFNNDEEEIVFNNEDSSNTYTEGAEFTDSEGEQLQGDEESEYTGEEADNIPE
jgi:hypothetical protein